MILASITGASNENTTEKWQLAIYKQLHRVDYPTILHILLDKKRWQSINATVDILGNPQQTVKIGVRASLPHSISATVIYFSIHFGTK